MLGDGMVEEVAGRTVLRFERRFAHPVERVWQALTDPEQLKQWVSATELEIDLVEGGRMYSRTAAPELVEAVLAEHPELDGIGIRERGFESHDTVLRVEPPRVFEHTFGAPNSVVRWELEPDGGGCHLRMSHTQPPGAPRTDAPRDLAGWHTLLELLGRVLDGQPNVAWSRQRWQEIVVYYRGREGG
jgi:uncharacterized protein YndB with AHSA1/START domain